MKFVVARKPERDPSSVPVKLMPQYPKPDAREAVLTRRDLLSRELVPLDAEDGAYTVRGLVAVAPHDGGVGARLVLAQG